LNGSGTPLFKSIHVVNCHVDQIVIAGLNNPKVSNFVLWILAELAVAACDITEGGRAET